MSGAFYQGKRGSIVSLSTITVNAAAILVLTTKSYRKAVYFRNAGAGDIYIGSSIVTTLLGIKLTPGATYVEEAGAASDFWAIGSAVGQTLVMVESW